jgi:hypothetical protein
LQRAHQQDRLRLDPFDRREDEHDAVEHAERALDLRDEVRVPGRVDQVDGHARDLEGDDRRSDRDAAASFEGEGVGLGGAAIHAADAVDHAGRVEQPFGEGGLTGVDVREDPEVEGRHGASCPSVGWCSDGWT